MREIIDKNTTDSFLDRNECNQIILAFVYLLFFNPRNISSQPNGKFQNWSDVYNYFISPIHVLDFQILNSKKSINNNNNINLNILQEIPWGPTADHLSNKFNWVSDYSGPKFNKKEIITLEVFDILVPHLKQKNSLTNKGDIYTPYNFALNIAKRSLLQRITTQFQNKTFSSMDDFKKFLITIKTEDSISLIKLFDKLRILDPSVGTGNFLIAVANILLEIRTNFQKELSPDVLKCKIIESNLFGIDIDPIAIQVTKIKLYLWAFSNSKRPIQNWNKIILNIFEGNSLFGFQDTHNLKNMINFHQLDSEFDKHIEVKLPIYRLPNVYKSNNSINYLTSISKSFLSDPNFKYFILEGNRSSWNNQKNNINKNLRKKIHFSVSSKKNSDFNAYAVFSKPLDFQNEKTFLYTQDECKALFIQQKFHWSRLGFFKSNKFDLIIGNPPFVALTDISLIYRKILQIEYPGIYSGNNDMSYFFLHRSITALRSFKGHLAFILPKYLLHSVYAAKIRQEITARTRILEIHDISEFSIFREVNIRNIILFLQEGTPSLEYSFTYIKYKKNDGIITKKKVFINQSSLDSSKWIFLEPLKLGLLKRMKSKQHLKLKDITLISKGIETGCDQIFTSNDKNYFSETLAIDKKHIRDWIKGKDIRRYYVTQKGREVLYTPSYRKNEIIADKKLMSYFNQNRPVLLKRSRVSDYFTWRKGDERKTMSWNSSKIVTPYKAKRNTFAIDWNGCLSSKDVIWLIPKAEYKNQSNFLHYLLGLLNSNIINFYANSTFKDLGGVYEYYPKQIQDIPVKMVDPESSKYKSICDLVIGLMEKSNQIEVQKYQQELNQLFYEIYGLSQNDIEIIEASL